MTSNDDNPKHVRCFTGKDSWCFWNKALAKGQEPGKHKEHASLPVQIGKRPVPIFRHPTEESLIDNFATIRFRTQINA